MTIFNFYSGIHRNCFDWTTTLITDHMKCQQSRCQHVNLVSTCMSKKYDRNAEPMWQYDRRCTYTNLEISPIAYSIISIYVWVKSNSWCSIQLGMPLDLDKCLFVCLISYLSWQSNRDWYRIPLTKPVINALRWHVLA